MDLSKLVGWTATSSVVFQAIAVLSRGLLSKVAAKSSLSPESKELLSSAMFSRYIISTLNALQSAAWGFHKLSLGTARWNDATGNRESVLCINGYMLADLFIIEKPSSEIATVLHHFVVVSSISGLLFGNIGPGFMSDVALMESSNVFLNIMWFFRSFGKTNSALYKALVTCFLITFFIGRIVWYPICLYRVKYVQPEEWAKLSTLLKFLVVSIWFLQVYWFRKIVQLLIRTLKK